MPDAARTSQKLPDMPALDGLRALSVVGVLIYHAEVGWLRGGFLGVEVFFVISGYLITALLLSEWVATGSINLKRFWAGRARRLLPALCVVLLSSGVFAVLFIPKELADLRSQTLAALGYVTNWYLVFAEQSYFEAMGRPSLLQHLWSLAIEEQFYLLWPLILGGGMFLWQRVKDRYKLFLAVLTLIAASTALAVFLYQPGEDPSRIYYGTDTRAAALLIGAALAFVWHPNQIFRDVSERFVNQGLERARFYGGRGLGRWLQLSLESAVTRYELLRLGALASLVLLFVVVSEEGAFLYRGGFAVVSIASAVLIAVVVHPSGGPIKRLLGCSPVRWVGTRSYGIYLWHWPVFMVTRPGIDIALQGVPAFAVRVGATLILAELSYTLVEKPIRQGALGRICADFKRSRGRRRAGVGLGAGSFCMGLIVLCSVLAIEMATAEEPKKPDYLAQSSVNTASEISTDNSQTPDVPAQGSRDQRPDAEEPATQRPAPPERSEGAKPPRPRPDAARTNSGAGASVDEGSRTEVSSVTAIGDSVLVGASGSLQHSLEQDGTRLGIQASVGMQATEAVSSLRELESKGQIGDVVVVHIGNNGPISERQFDRIMDSSSEAKKVVFVTNQVPRSWESSNNRVIEQGVRGEPKAVLADWKAVSEGKRGYFYDDGIHLTPEGQQAYSRLMESKIGSG